MEQAAKQNHHLYNKALRPIAKALRRNMTKAEACLWKYVLRAGMLKGYTFNRQRPVKNYVVDFLCKKLFLVIEVDGVTHDNEQAQSEDEAREQKLVKAGFAVMRFTDDEVLNNIDSVRRTLEIYIEEREKALGLPPPIRLRRISPSVRGTNR